MNKNFPMDVGSSPFLIIIPLPMFVSGFMLIQTGFSLCFQFPKSFDKSFKENFKSNPRQVLNDNGVFLPDDMILEFQKPNSDRPKIIVYEKKQNSNFKIRVVQLQLVMLAGR